MGFDVIVGSFRPICCLVSDLDSVAQTYGFTPPDSGIRDYLWCCGIGLEEILTAY
jgi:hypothetical protein